MKRFLTTTAAIALIAGPAIADGHKAAATFLDQSQMTTEMDGQLRASDLIGKRVYVTEMEVEAGEVNTAEIEWDDIGEVNDILLNRDGSVQAVMLDIGGFLGMGEKTVALSMEKLNLVSGMDDGLEYYVVFNGNRATLEESKEYDTSKIGMWAKDSKSEMKDADAEETTAAAADNTEDRAGTYMADAPMVTMDGREKIMLDDLTTEDLTGAVVYDSAEENIGEINELLVSTDGKLTDAIIDVGGFLGLGEKQVRVDMNSLTITRELDDGDVHVYVDATKDALMAQPEYED